MDWSYEESLKYLHGMPRTRSRPGIDRMLRFCGYLGNPHLKLSGRFLHVAGTNGKGSACAMLTSVLREAGLDIGAFISPYIMEFRERIAFNGAFITEEEVCRYTRRLRDAVRQMERETGEKPIEFELVCGMGLLFFAERMPDLIVCEAGMGGRNDPTNIIQPILSIIMRIDYDHMELLGTSIEEIASEKAGIIKQNTPVVLYPDQYPEAMRVLTSACKSVHAPFRIPDIMGLSELPSDPFFPAFHYRKETYTLSLAGRHQILNASCIIEAVDLLREKGIAVDSAALSRGLRRAFLPARLERLSQCPLILLDGAHNASGVRALTDTLRQESGGRPLAVLCGMLEDKHPDTALPSLFTLDNLSYAACVPVHSPRSADPGRLCTLFRANGIQSGVYADSDTALDAVLQKTGNEGIGVCFGSLYLASDIRRYFGRIRTDGV